MYIVCGDDHLCDILYHAYSWPLYSYVSGTAICIWVNPRTWVTLFGKHISEKIEKRTSVEGLLSP